MNRAEFSKKTRAAALARSMGQCEAVGPWYGLPPRQRCGNSLNRGVEFDHIILDANSHDNSLENCAAVCKRCHNWKSQKHDVPLAAKTVRQREKDIGLRRSSRPMPCGRKSEFKKKMDGSVVRRSP